MAIERNTESGEQFLRDGLKVQTSDLTPIDAINAKNDEQDDRVELIETDTGLNTTAIATINSTAIFMHPDSPHVRKLDWLGNQFQYDLILLNGGTYTTDTNYDVNDSLDSKFFFTTKDVSPVTSILTGVSPDSRSIGSNEVTILADGMPSYSYGDSSIEHLVQFDNFDKSLTTRIDFTSDGLTEIGDVSAFDNLTLGFKVSGNPLLTVVPGLENCSIKGQSLELFNCDFNGVVELPQIIDVIQVNAFGNPNMTELNGSERMTSINSILNISACGLNVEYKLGISDLNELRISNNADLPALTTSDGCLFLKIIQVQNCALDQTSVDMLILDTWANAQAGSLTNGLLNISGGTNAIPSNTTPVNDAISGLLGLGYTLTLNS